MKLTRLSLVCIAGCLIGLVAIAVAGVTMLQQVNARQADMHALMVLQSRIDNFSAASDGMLSQRMDHSLWRAYRADAADLQRALATQQETYPAAQRAIHYIAEIVAVLEDVYAENPDAQGTESALLTTESIDGSLRAQIITTRIAAQGMAIDRAMQEIDEQQRSAINNNINWIMGGFAGTTLLFGLACTFAFTLLYRRIHGPLKSLTQVASRVERGDSSVRVQLRGKDEFNELATTFNRMLDRQQSDQDNLEERARLLDIAGDLARFGGWWVDLRDNRCYWSALVADIHGLPHDYSPNVEDGIGFYVPEHRQRIRDRFNTCVESGTPYDEELQIIGADGQRRWVRTIGTPVRDSRGAIVKVEGAFQDVTSQHEMTENLRHALKMRHALIDSLPAHIAVLDTEGNIFDINEHWRHFGMENAMHDEQLGVGNNYLDVCRNARGDNSDGARESEAGLRALLNGEQDKFSLEYPCHAPTRKRWFRLMARRLESAGETDAPLGAVVMHIDITERKLAELQLEKQAFQDPLTGLLNRAGFTAALNRHLDKQGWQAHNLVVVMDIKGQSNINDAHGYEVGDRLLNQIGDRLKEKLETGVVGCTNGDSFTLLLCGTGTDRIEDHWQWLNTLLHEPFAVGNSTIEVSARFGFTLLGEQPRSAERLLHEAEIALLEARRVGLRDWGSFTPRLDREIHERIELTRDLQRALSDNEFELHFQPKVNLHSGELIACEALLRWVHPEHGMMSPGRFIPIAEQSKLIGPIGEWVLFEACRQLRLWQDASLEVVQMSVNVSMVQFEQGGLIDQVRQAIATHGIDPVCLTLEITESVFAHHSQVLLDQMKELHALGVRLSLDDFGTGYSSLLYLQRYPFDEIKIDMGFVRKLVEDPYSQRIVTTVLGISAVLGTETVAEGIESSEIRDLLLDMGCHIGQGYYYSMPLVAEDFQWLLEKGSTLPSIPGSATSPEASSRS
jgi:diguanylate cyclase (GGDEF)-like protein/PAS domain S-box-containing protein